MNMRMKLWGMSVALASMVGLVGASAAGEGHEDHGKMAAETKITPQTTCPVMGGKINEQIFADHDGKRVYFCCAMCPKEFAKDPQKYIKKLGDQGVTVAKVQTTCPVMGGKINKDHYVDAKGNRIYVCCPGCIGKIKADPDTYIKKLEDAGVALDPAPADKSDSAHKGHHH